MDWMLKELGHWLMKNLPQRRQAPSSIGLYCYTEYLFTRLRDTSSFSKGSTGQNRFRDVQLQINNLGDRDQWTQKILQFNPNTGAFWLTLCRVCISNWSRKNQVIVMLKSMGWRPRRIPEAITTALEQYCQAIPPWRTHHHRIILWLCNPLRNKRWQLQEKHDEYNPAEN